MNFHANASGILKYQQNFKLEHKKQHFSAVLLILGPTIAF